MGLVFLMIGVSWRLNPVLPSLLCWSTLFSKHVTKETQSQLPRFSSGLFSVFSTWKHCNHPSVFNTWKRYMCQEQNIRRRRIVILPVISVWKSYLGQWNSPPPSVTSQMPGQRLISNLKTAHVIMCCLVGAFEVLDANGAMVEWWLAWQNIKLGLKSAPLPFHPTAVSLEITWSRTWGSAVLCAHRHNLNSSGNLGRNSPFWTLHGTVHNLPRHLNCMHKMNT